MTVRILVTGSRSWDDADYIRKVLDTALIECASAFDSLVLHHGDCPKGADKIADDWAREVMADSGGVMVSRHPAQWRDSDGRLDRRAGFRRNADMVLAVVHADVSQTAICHAFIRDHSSGATHCANVAAKSGIPVIRHRWEDR